MTIKESLLILCGGAEAVPCIQVAQSMGLHTIVVDGNVDAPGRLVADDFIHASIYHPSEVILALDSHIKNMSINGVITVAADNPVTVATVANHLGLPSLLLCTAHLATHKLEMKKALLGASILTPWFIGIKSLEQLEEIVSTRPALYVLKPVDSRGSRGVIRLSKLQECHEAFAYSSQYSMANELILEEWIEGEQLSSESIVSIGESYLCGLADRNYNRLSDLYPFVVEDGGETPSRLSSIEMETSINNLMNMICKAIGLVNGSIKGDLVFSKGTIYVIEFAARLSGGSFSTVTIPLVYEYNLVENVIRMALGRSPVLPPNPLVYRRYQCNRFFFIPAGKISSITKIPISDNGIINFQLSVKPGDITGDIKNHTMRAGSVLTIAATCDEAIDLATAVINSVKFEIDHSELIG